MKCASKHFCIMCCIVSVIVIALSGAVSSVHAQTTSTGPAFEVATVKPSTYDPTKPETFNAEKHWIHAYKTRVTCGEMSVKSFVAVAYGVQQFQVLGSGLMDTPLFDIEATFPEGATQADVPKMLQALLKDRFKLAFHIEKKESETYALVVGKHGAKLVPSPPDLPESAPDAQVKAEEGNVGGGAAKSSATTNKDGSSTGNMGKHGTMTIKFDMETMSQHFERSKMTMEELVGMLTMCTGGGGHKVDDQTGLKGEFQVAWDCPTGISLPKNQSGGDASDALPSDPQGGGVLAKSLDALGLKLEKLKVPMDIYIIDHVEKPSEN
jgi:uncharacterized protein (TIGR03435 family)